MPGHRVRAKQILNAKLNWGNMQKSKLVITTALSFIFSSTMFVSAQAKKLKIPENRVIEVYQIPDLSEAGGTVAAGSGPGGPNDPADLSRYQVTSKTYAGTILTMQGMLDEIRKKSPDKTLNPKVRIFNSAKPEGRAINRDLIIISTGLIQALTGQGPIIKEAPEKLDISDTDGLSSLSFILAHEYAHLLYGHHILYKQKEDETRGFTKLIAGSLQVMHTAQSLNREFGGGLNKEFVQANKTLNAAAISTPWVEAELYRYSYAPFRKQAEQMADYMASDLLSNPDNPSPKYNAQRGAQPMRGLYKIYDNSVKAQMKRLAKDAGKTATVASKQMAASAPLVALNGGDVGAFLSANLKAVAIAFGAKQLLGRLSKKRTHLYYSAEKRVDAIDEYYGAFYPVKNEKASAAQMAANMAFAAMFEKENSAAAAADQAIVFLTRGDIEGAAKALASVTGTEKYTDTKYITASGHVTFAQGNFGAAISNYNKVKNKGDVTEQVFRRLSQSYMLQENPEMAISTLDEGMQTFSTETYIAEKIGLLVVLERDEEALVVYEQCVALGDKKLAKVCKTQAKPILETETEDDGLLKGVGGLLKKGTGL